MFFNESRWDAMNEYIKESYSELKKYVNKRFEIQNEYDIESRKEMDNFVADMFRIKQIEIDHLQRRIELLEKELDELKKKES